MGSKYCVYEHVFPNKKRYVGITSTDPDTRFGKDGSGYKNQKKIWNAIKLYGWENIEHNIIIDNVSEDNAKKLEQYLIRELDTIENGYNVSVGGDNINGTYLNPHILEMIRLSRACDAKLMLKEKEDDIVHYVYKKRYDSDFADFINSVDNYVNDNCNYMHFHSNFMCDGENMRVDAYWWYVIQTIKLWAGTSEYIIPYERALCDQYFGGNKNGSYIA